MMAVVLILLWTAGNGAGAIHIASFADMPSCLNAARSTEMANLAGNPPPGVSFACVPAK